MNNLQIVALACFMFAAANRVRGDMMNAIFATVVGCLVLAAIDLGWLS